MNANTQKKGIETMKDATQIIDEISNELRFGKKYTGTSLQALINKIENEMPREDETTKVFDRKCFNMIIAENDFHKNEASILFGEMVGEVN